MGQGRTFSRAFKLSVVRQIEAGQRPAQVCREHGIADGVLWRWRREVARRGAAAFAAQTPSGEAALRHRIAELERFCGQLALENEALKRGLSNRAARNGTP